MPKEVFGKPQSKHSRVISMCSVLVCREKALPSGTAVLRTSTAGSLSHQLPHTCEISSLEELKVWAQRWPFPSADPPDTASEDGAWTVNILCTIHSVHCSNCGFSLAGDLLSQHRKCYSFPEIQMFSLFWSSASISWQCYVACAHKTSREGALTLYMLNSLVSPSYLSPPLMHLPFYSCLPTQITQGQKSGWFF